MYDSTRRIFGILSATGDPDGTGSIGSASGPAGTGAHRSGHGQWTAP